MELPLDDAEADADADADAELLPLAVAVADEELVKLRATSVRRIAWSWALLVINAC